MKKQPLPSKIRIGRTQYKVVLRDRIESDVMGRISYSRKTIEVATQQASGRPYPHVEIRNTFWHEIVHGVLQDMGSKLTDDERFVNAFANRLSDAIDSARF